MNRAEMKIVSFGEENVIATSAPKSTWSGYRLGGLGSGGASDDFLHVVTNGVEGTQNIMTTDYRTLMQYFYLDDTNYFMANYRDTDSNNYGDYNGFYVYDDKTSTSRNEKYRFVSSTLPSSN